MEVLANSALVVRTKNPDKITQVIQKSKVIKEGHGVHDVAVHWNLGNAMILKNLGFKKVLSPILGKYDWPGIYSPFDHQRDTASFLTLHRRAFCLNAMGTGKTSAVAWAADYLLNTKAIKRVLIVCPLSIMDCAWRSDLFNTVMHRRVGIAHGTKEQRIAVIKGKADFVIINYDGIEVVRDEILQGGFDLIVCDESTALKNVKTRRWKTLNSLIKADTWLWLLTGTPAAQSPEDAYGQARLVNPSAVPGYAGAWKDKVMLKTSQFKYVPRPEAQDIVYEALQPAIRYKTEDCLDLPDMLYSDRQIPMTAQQKKYYDKLRKEQLIQAAGTDISAVNAAVQMGKLLQISCIVYNTPVLTDIGWIPIQDVSAKHKVWDGEEWVDHGGVIFRGVKQVEDCYGVSMTLDHNVLTTQGWRTAGDILYGKSGYRFDAAKVRLPDCDSKGRNISWESKKSQMALSLRLWEHYGKGEPILAGEAQKIPKELWLPPRERNAQNELPSGVFQLSKHDTPLSQSLQQGLQKLRGTGYSSMRKLAVFIRGVLVRYGAGIQEGAHTGSNRQQWPIFPRKLPMGYRRTAGAEQTDECTHRHPERFNAHSTSGEGVWDQAYHIEKTPKGGLARRNSPDGASRQEQKTYDLLNCGPRARFVVAGHQGPLIVHNCGSVYSDTGEVVEFDCSNKLEELLDIVQQVSHKTLVFCAFRHSIDLVERYLNKHGITTAAIHGDVSAKKRTVIFKEFQTDKNPQVLVIQPQAAAHGVTLTAANTVVWFSPTTSAETYLQANARVHRSGQKNPCLVVHLCSSPVETKLYKALASRTLAQKSLLEMYQSFLGGAL
jgi:superfamily II DNA or RNA helicase